MYGREDLAPVFDELNKYEATTHFMGQSTVVLDGERATGETYCIAHHVSASEGKRTLFIASIRYCDVFAKVEGRWLFADLINSRVKLALAATGDVNICALLHEPLGRGKADAAASTCDYSNFSFQSFHGILIVMTDFNFSWLASTKDAFTACSKKIC